MKITKLRVHFLLIFLSVYLSTFLAYSQTMEQEFVFHGLVKEMILTKTDYSSTRNLLVTTTEFDKKARKIREISPYSSTTEYFYGNLNTTKPILVKSYNTGDSKIENIIIEEKDHNDQVVLNGTLDDNNWRYYYIHDYSPNLHITKWFTDGEIYNRTTEESIDLSKFKIPAGFVPFDWDQKLSKGTVKKKYSYSSDDYDHVLIFEFIQKNKPQNKITFYYNGDDVYDAGKGYWHYFENDQKIEERYIHAASQISDFGHRLTYNTKGKLLSDQYGYFRKMPEVFMQRTLYSYNDNGDCIKETRDAENSKTDFINYQYSYDAEKNWTSRKSIYSDDSGSTIKRSFSYYKSDEMELKNSLTENSYQKYLKVLRANKSIAEAQYKNYIKAKSQKNNTVIPDINYKALRSKDWQDFLPIHQKLDTLTTGDLNKDGLQDLVMVYSEKKLLKDERNDFRTLRILIQQNDGNYQLAAESKGAVAGDNMNNLYFSGIEVKKGILIVTHEFIRGGSQHKYRYQNGGFYLIGAAKQNGDASYFDSIDYNLSTGKYISIYENWDQDKNRPKSSKKENIQKLPALPNIETYELFTVKVGGDNL